MEVVVEDSHCAKDALTDQFGWTVQAVLAWLAFMCLVCKFLLSYLTFQRDCKF